MTRQHAPVAGLQSCTPAPFADSKLPRRCAASKHTAPAPYLTTPRLALYSLHRAPWPPFAERCPLSQPSAERGPLSQPSAEAARPPLAAWRRARPPLQPGAERGPPSPHAVWRRARPLSQPGVGRGPLSQPGGGRGSLSRPGAERGPLSQPGAERGPLSQPSVQSGPILLALCAVPPADLRLGLQLDVCLHQQNEHNFAKDAGKQSSTTIISEKGLTSLKPLLLPLQSLRHAAATDIPNDKSRNADRLVAETEDIQINGANTHESQELYESEWHALTVIRLPTATRRGGGRSNSGVRACEHACEVFAHKRCTARARSPMHAGLPNSSMAILRSSSNYYSHMNENGTHAS
eukprot:3624887-Pleurochrysis_carterae.AAC.2